VVVAVPLNNLGRIGFAPALAPAKRAVVDQGQASRGLKLWAQVRGDLEPFFFMAPDDCPLTFLGTEKLLEDGSQLLVASGPDAERLRPGDDQQARRVLGEWLPAGVEIVAVTGHDWCAMSSPARDLVGRPARPAERAPRPASPAGRVVFAGSDLADGWNGFMDGAIESGLRAARSVPFRT
jgi:Flavin containing amine oxidoreductase